MFIPLQIVKMKILQKRLAFMSLHHPSPTIYSDFRSQSELFFKIVLTFFRLLIIMYR